MRIVPSKQFRVGIIPSWLAALAANTNGGYKSLLDFPSLAKDDGSSILTQEELFIYILVQLKFQTLTKGNFADLHTIAEEDENQKFVLENKAALDKVSDALALTSKINSELKKNENLHDIIAEGQNPLAAEYYTPLAVDANTLLLIGSTVPIYKDTRAYFNAVMEAITSISEYSEYKTLEAFKLYLRNAVSER